MVPRHYKENVNSSAYWMPSSTRPCVIVSVRVLGYMAIFRISSARVSVYVFRSSCVIVRWLTWTFECREAFFTPSYAPCWSAWPPLPLSLLLCPEVTSLAEPRSQALARPAIRPWHLPYLATAVSSLPTDGSRVVFDEMVRRHFVSFSLRLSL